MRRFILGVAIAFITFVIGSSASSAWNLIDVEENPEPVIFHEPLTSCYFPASAYNSVAEEDIHELFRQYGIAETNHDTDFFERVEADKFILTFRSGDSLTRDEAITGMVTRGERTQYSNEVLDIEFYGDVAFVKTEMAETYPNRQHSSNFRWLHVLKKDNGRWQILSSTEIY